MVSVNKVTILGALGKDPEVRYTSNSKAIATISVATSYKAKDKEPETEWHRVVFFGRLAEIANEYLKKGSSVYVEGRLRTQKWTDKNGVERYTTEIVAEQMQMLGGNKDEKKPATPAKQAQQPDDDDLDSDLPF